MNRRSFLKNITSAAVIGAAGCLESPSQSSSASLSSISSIRINTTNSELAYSVDFITRNPEESPIGFTVSCINTLSETITVSDATELLFENNTDTSDTFVLLSESYQAASKDSTCWSISPTDVKTDNKKVISIDPQETVTKDLYIVSYTGCSFETSSELVFKSTSYMHNTNLLSEGKIMNAELVVR